MYKLNKSAIATAISSVMPRIVSVRKHGTHIIERRSFQLCGHGRENGIKVMVQLSNRRYYNVQVNIL
jgi:hypothetical protein